MISNKSNILFLVYKPVIKTILLSLLILILD